MVGTIGAGGIGDMAIQYGYNRYETGVLVVIVIILYRSLCRLIRAGWRSVRAQGDALMVAYMRECAHIQSQDDREG